MDNPFPTALEDLALPSPSPATASPKSATLHAPVISDVIVKVALEDNAEVSLRM
jgi:hypothetical protein